MANKELIVKSIEIYGMGHPDTKTVFHLNEIAVLPEDATEEQKKENADKEIENQKILNDIRFKSLTTISGRTLTAWFKYTDEGVEKSDKLRLVIIKSDQESEIKDFVIDSINTLLN
jgi:hypothetical protein